MIIARKHPWIGRLVVFALLLVGVRAPVYSAAAEDTTPSITEAGETVRVAGDFASQDRPARRLTVPLDGIWQIGDSTSPTEMPSDFTRTVPVPGLANLARPRFGNVDQFISRENLANRIRAQRAPVEWMRAYWNGKVDQDRNYFWYKKTFRAPDRRAVAWLKINKAQFGTAVWLNGEKLGEYAGCFTASLFPIERAIRWNGENTLVVRIGAHPAVVPDTFPTGSDFEKTKWTPGIYDSVALIFCDNPAIETVQVAPRSTAGEIVVQTKVKNHSGVAVQAALAHTVKPWRRLPARASAAGTRSQAIVASVRTEPVTMKAGEERVFTQTIKLPNARLWSPEDPFLYIVESSTGGDSVRTRFGMREFRFHTTDKRAHLNGREYYLRGSNITLHRFFEDPLCGDLPWNEAWVRRLLGELPMKMHWNYFRFCIGPVPDRWLEICDEVGLLVQNEFFVWTGRPAWYRNQGYSRRYDSDEMIRQYRDWMRDNWNHPSVIVWDANNETEDGTFGTKIIPAIRALDLSDRPWENSYNAPVGPGDPVEYHPYLMSGGYRGKLTFKMSDLETRDGTPTKEALPALDHPTLINEYGWLWLNRDGTPTLLTENVYAQLMEPKATPRDRLDLYAYLLAAKTEYWRAHRRFAGIVHFVYLTGSFPGVYTADHFRDVARLELDPAFADYVGEAFKPLGVYLNFFRPTLAPGISREFPVKLVNDHAKPLSGALTLTLETKDGEVLARAARSFALPALGAGDFPLTLAVPGIAAKDLCLKATARPTPALPEGSTMSRRTVSVLAE